MVKFYSEILKIILLFGKKGTFCQILPTAASDYRTLISFGLILGYCCDVDHPRGSRVLGFLDSPLTFNYRKNNGYFTFNAISVYKVYIDFQIKILGRLFFWIIMLFANFNRIFQIIFNPLRSCGNKSSSILKAAGLFKYV